MYKGPMCLPCTSEEWPHSEVLANVPSAIGPVLVLRHKFSSRREKSGRG